MRGSLTLHDRCLSYARGRCGQLWPDSTPYVTPSGLYVYGRWVIGALFENETDFPGCYPRTYLERVLSMFPDVRRREILHLFSGSLPKGPYTRVDINPDRKPEIVGSIYDLPQLLEARGELTRYKLVLCDPPYPGQGQKLYGTDDVVTWRAFRALEALPAGTHVVWLDTITPMRRKEYWNKWGSVSIEPEDDAHVPDLGTRPEVLDDAPPEWRKWGAVRLERSTNQGVREVTFLERRAS